VQVDDVLLAEGLLLDNYNTLAAAPVVVRNLLWSVLVLVGLESDTVSFDGRKLHLLVAFGC
jgi:hypothetical protein